MAIVVATPADGETKKAAARERPSQKLCKASATRLMYASLMLFKGGWESWACVAVEVEWEAD